MTTALPFQDLFEFKCLLDDLNIRLSSRIENGVKQLLALITDDGDILLYYTYGELCSVLKRVPWFSDPNKTVQALCFDPSATWLLVVCLDCSLYIIPALSLVDKKQKIDCKWSVHDVTHFPKPPQVTDSKPSSLIWWQTLDCNQNALVGFENGNISLISLTDGRCFGTCAITETIVQLNLFLDNTLDAVSLMINGVSGQQWKLVLEQHSMGYLWPPDANTLTDDPTKSRLQNLKQLSAEKLAYLKQKFTETRHSRRDSQNSDSESVSSDNSHSGPELLPHLCDTHFAPQYAKNRYLFSAFYKPTSLVTVHSGDVETAPLYVHKLQQKTDYLLLTDRLIYTVNSELNILSILSSQLSECRLEGDSEFNPESLIAQFTMTRDNEKILNIYKLTDVSLGRERRKKEDSDVRTNILPKNVGELLISRVKVDTCIVVTNSAVYKLLTKCSPVNKFINLIIEDCNLEKAERLAIIFGLNLQRLFESCGDLLVANGSFHQGLILYKQAKIHLLKRVLKLAVSADCKSLLKFIHLCLSASRVDMSIGTKIHIGNLAVMAYTELLLRYNGHMRISNTKDFLNFLCFEEYYDQVLAVNVACQAGHWKVVNLLTKARGLQPESVVAVSQILQTTRAPRPTEYDFLIAISEPSLIQSMLIYPTSCQIILNYMKDNMNQFPLNILRRLAVLLDPSQPTALPLLHKLQWQRQRKDTANTDCTIESVDFDPTPHISGIFKEIIETFIFVLLTLIQKTEDNNSSYSLQFLEKIPEPDLKIEEPSIPKYPKLNTIHCGYEHIGVIRNHNLYMMGISTSGSLGLGPLLTQSSPIKLVSTLSELRVKVLGVSCGRKHTLVLTDYGVYSWGSNYYGQLGLDTLLQETPYPQLLIALNDYNIIDVQAGQYHSMALTSSGKVFTWGWGIHGQLGHGISANEFYPRELQFNEPIKQISAGYAHSFILTVDGKLYGFGSNAFGQLEICNIDANKSTKPVWVLVMPDFYRPIENVNTSYFHNICTTSDQEVFVWGASPQEVRVSQSKSNQKLNGIDPKMADSWKSCVRIYTSKTKKSVDEISIGFKYSGILHGGRVIWGKSKETELISQNNKKEAAPLAPRYIHVASGYDYMIAMEHNGRMVAWGNTTFAQKIICKQQPEDGANIMMIRNAKGRCVKVPNCKEGSFETPVEIPGLPTMAISYDNLDPRLSTRNYAPYAVRSIENKEVHEKRNHRPPAKGSFILEQLQDSYNFKFGQKTLHYVLETYADLYDYENVLTKCLEMQNYQAASKVAMVDEHFSDSLSFQLKAFKKHMDSFDLEFNINIVPKDDSFCNKKNEINKQNDINCVKIDYSSHNSPARVLSTSSSLDSIRQWGEEEHQGGCESPCELSELGDVRQNMSQYVQSFKNDSPPISTVSQIISSQPTYVDHKSNEIDFEVHVKDENTRDIINIASSIVEFYIKKTYATENHILMQNILMKCIEFWLSNNLPVCILEKVLLKNMDKYFYPLSILLFCKNFNNNLGDKNELDPNEQKPAGFLKDFSTKFCLQLCSMVLENVNKA